MKRATAILSLAILIFCAASFARAQNKPGAAGGAARPEEAATAKSGEAISRDQADAILGELRAIHLLLERQELRAAAAQQPRAPAPPERVSLSLADAKQWYSQGKEDAPVTIIEFTDYQCPYCRRFDQSTFADLKKNYIETGKVRFLARDLPLDFHTNAQRAAEAARCAGDQGKFWEMRGVLFTAGGELTREAILKDAQSLALNEETFTSCLDLEKHKAEIQADLADSARLRITGTPTFVIGRSGKDVLEGVKVNGALPLAAFDAAIRQALRTEAAALPAGTP
ncbi:MAG TPA: thioredoxin domain-containing protein [Candidatus Binatia bacterium]|nr:thioredoxin domain-containing protein [Candidatus Binatia bacterium]